MIERRNAGIILGLVSANEKQRYNATLSRNSWAHTKNYPCVLPSNICVGLLIRIRVYDRYYHANK